MHGLFTKRSIYKQLKLYSLFAKPCAMPVARPFAIPFEAQRLSRQGGGTPLRQRRPRFASAALREAVRKALRMALRTALRKTQRTVYKHS